MHVVGNPETSYKPYSLRQKLRSISLSLDALLDYNDKDIEESTFEVNEIVNRSSPPCLHMMPRQKAGPDNTKKNGGRVTTDVWVPGNTRNPEKYVLKDQESLQRVCRFTGCLSAVAILPSIGGLVDMKPIYGTTTATRKAKLERKARLVKQ
ncbi:uncharacterized protein LOC131246148 [Magnolia sinica]|uniref:uncharacterized protein LOC131246148 n=1 Tax=Magnolia sinica TaxID=86752 RepID=UPI002658336C|nr:uncharacterized protein LOC131246148 [Magnolia sinica]